MEQVSAALGDVDRAACRAIRHPLLRELPPGARQGRAVRRSPAAWPSGGSRLQEDGGHKHEIEAAYGGPLSWEPLEGKKASRIATYRDEAIERREQWPEYQQWLLENLGRLRQAIQPFVDALG